MAMSVEKFSEQIIALLPSGSAWDIANNPYLKDLIAAASEEFARIDADIDAMFNESLPSKTINWLPEWLADWGLPSQGTALPETTEEQQALLVARVTAVGGDDRARLLDVAEKLGYGDITITEFMPGESIPGHPEIDPNDSPFYVQITGLPLVNLTEFRAGDVAGTYIRDWEQAIWLESELNQTLHSHKQLLFVYGGA